MQLDPGTDALMASFLFLRLVPTHLLRCGEPISGIIYRVLFYCFGCSEFIQLLVLYRADVDMPGGSGDWTPLMFAGAAG